MFKKLINLYKVFKNKRYLYLYMEKDINVFLEESCGFKNKQSNKVTNIINDKNIVLENINNENDYFSNYQNNYNLIQKIMKKFIFNDEFYLYNNNISLFENNQLNIKDHVNEIDKILYNDISTYENKIDELKKDIQILNDKINSNEIKESQQKQLNLKLELKNRKEEQKKIMQDLTPYEKISLQDGIDKIEKDLKNITNKIKEIPILQETLKKNIQNKCNEIKEQQQWISILKSFPLRDYKKFLNIKIKKLDIKNSIIQTNVNTEKKIRKLSLLFQTYIIIHLIFSESFLFQINLLTIFFFYLYNYLL